MILPDFEIFFTHLKDENPDLGLWGKKLILASRQSFLICCQVPVIWFFFLKKESIIFRIKNYLNIYIFMLSWILNWLQKLTSHWNPSRQDWCPKLLFRIFLLDHVEWYLVFGLYYWPWKTSGIMMHESFDIFEKYKTHFLVA